MRSWNRLQERGGDGEVTQPRHGCVQARRLRRLHHRGAQAVGRRRYALLSEEHRRWVTTADGGTHYCLKNIDGEWRRPTAVRTTVWRTSTVSDDDRRRYALLSEEHQRWVTTADGGTHYCLKNISGEWRRPTAVRTTVWRTSTVSDDGRRRYALLSEEHQRWVTTADGGTHYCLKNIDGEWRRPTAVRTTVWRTSAVIDDGRWRYALLSEEHRRWVTTADGGTHYCLKNIGGDWRRPTAVRTTVWRTSTVSDDGRRRYALLSEEHQRWVTTADGGTHYCLKNINGEWRRPMAVRTTVWRTSAVIDDGRRRYALLSEEHRRWVTTADGGTHYCLKNINDEWWRPTAVRTTVWRTSAVIDDGRRRYALLSEEHQRWVTTADGGTHYCLKNISGEWRRPTAVRTTVWRTSAVSDDGRRRYALLSEEHQRWVTTADGGTHYCLKNINGEWRRPTAVRTTVWRTSTVSDDGRRRYALLSEEYQRWVMTADGGTHYCLKNINDEWWRPTAVRTTVWRTSTVSDDGRRRYALLSEEHQRWVTTADGGTHYCLKNINGEWWRPTAVRTTVWRTSTMSDDDRRRYALLSEEHQRWVTTADGGTHYCLKNINGEWRRPTAVRTTVWRTSAVSDDDRRRYALLSEEHQRWVMTADGGTHYCLKNINGEWWRPTAVRTTVWRTSAVIDDPWDLEHKHRCWQLKSVGNW